MVVIRDISDFLTFITPPAKQPNPIETLKQENNSLNNTIETLKQENNSLNNTIETLKQENNSLKDKIETLEKKKTQIGVILGLGFAVCGSSTVFLLVKNMKKSKS